MSELPPVDPKFNPFWTPGTVAVCVKDDPPMYGFGRSLKAGDEIVVQGVCWRAPHYELSAREECAFYRMIGYFEPKDTLGAPGGEGE